MNTERFKAAQEHLRTPSGKLAFTVTEACYSLGIGRTKLYELIAEKKLKAIKIGTATRISADSIHALMAQEAA